MQAGVLLDEYGECAREESVVRVDADVAQLYVLLFRDDGGDVVDDANVVVSDDSERDWVVS